MKICLSLFSEDTPEHGRSGIAFITGKDPTEYLRNLRYACDALIRHQQYKFEAQGLCVDTEEELHAEMDEV